MEYNLSKGKLFQNMLSFSLPFLLSYFLQTLYGMADLIIVGQYYGAEVISAVSIGSQIMHMLTVMIVGLAMGSTVMIGRKVGAGESVSGIIGNTVVLFTVTALISTVLLLLSSSMIVGLVNTPPESVADAGAYLRICFMGIPFIIAYNILSSIFRGMGDSKSPMRFIALACVFNILFDFIFIAVLDMRAAGAALATVLAQLISVIYAVGGILKKKELRLSKADFKIDRALIASIFGIGFPIMCQDGFIQISFLLITVIANRRGVEISAAVGMVEKLIGFLFLVPSTMLSTVSTIAAQNLGAGEEKRARDSLAYGIMLCTVVGAVFAVFFQFAAEPVFSLFTKDILVREYAVQYMRTYVFDCILAGVHFSFSGFFTASRRSALSFIHNLLSVLLVRVPGAYLATIFFPATLYAMGAAPPLGSLLSVVLCIAFYKRYFRTES